MFTLGFKKLFVVLFLPGLLIVPLEAQTAKVSPTPGVIPRALPVDKPGKEKKPGLLDKLFGKKPTPAPTPVFTPTPTPKPKVKKRPRPVSADPTPTPTPSATPASATLIDPTNPNPGLVPLPDVPVAGGATPLPASLPPMVGGTIDNSNAESPDPATLPKTTAKTSPAQPIIPASTPISAEIRNNPMNQPIAIVDDSTPLEIVPGVETAAQTLEKLKIQREQFQKIKAKALEDSKLAALRDQSEVAATPAERYTALKAYYPKLFASMRKLDGTIAPQIDEMEAAARRRLERMAAENAGAPPAP